MKEAVRRRLLWSVLGATAGIAALTLGLSAAGVLGAAWLTFVAVAYAALFALGVVGFVAYEGEGRMVRVPLRDAGASVERVLYATPRGEVVEAGPPGRRALRVESDGASTPLDEVARALDRGPPLDARPPDEEELRAALSRWGRMREGSG